jgi:hypothetical protein
MLKLDKGNQQTSLDIEDRLEKSMTLAKKTITELIRIS